MSWSQAQLFRSLAVMYRGGVPLLRAVKTLQVQWHGAALGEALDSFHSHLCSGHSMSQAGRKVGAPFQALHVALFELGERSGGLDDALEVLACYEEDSCRLRQEIHSQLAYPLLVLAVMLAMLGVGLPWLAHSLPGSFSWTPPLLILAGLMSLATHYGRLLKWLGARPPLVDLRRAWACSQFLGLWSGLLERGVPLATSLQLAGQANPCEVCRQACAELMAQVIAGEDLGKAFQDCEYFGPALKGCVLAGLECGSLPAMLKALKQLEDQKLACTIQALVALLTPAITVLLGLLLLLFLQQTLTPLLALVSKL